MLRCRCRTKKPLVPGKPPEKLAPPAPEAKRREQQPEGWRAGGFADAASVVLLRVDDVVDAVCVNVEDIGEIGLKADPDGGAVSGAVAFHREVPEAGEPEEVR